ncbi:MAG: hypothetical protein EA362_02680 [Saprospirales bacterium]|nr:MAG: hypothetical protein EA362_02680 [Saprospirales bacterium]
MTKNAFDFEEMFRIQAECEQKLAKQTVKKTSRHQLKSVHHLSDRGSKLVSHPIALLAEYMYFLYEKLRDYYLSALARFFPRNEHIFLNSINSSVIGRLTFSDKKDYHTPIHHMHVELWAKTRLWQWIKLSEADTDTEGYFELPFDMSVIHRNRIAKKIRLEIYHTNSHHFNEHPIENTAEYRAERLNSLFKTIKINKSDLTGMSYNMGTIPLFYWEYRHDTALPRVVIKDHDLDAPQKYPKERLDAIATQFIPIELITRKHLLRIKRGKKLTIEDIQADYPENLTVAMEKMKPGITRSDQWFADRMVNGMYASTLDVDPENPNFYWLYYHWSSYDHKPDYAFNDISMKFSINDKGYFLPESITLKGPISPGAKAPSKITLTPNDGQKWDAAKRVARVSGGILTEVDKHFTETHLNTEQYAIAAYRNIRRNPIGSILFPHLRNVVLINHTADEILINESGYINRATALTPAGISKRVYDVLGTLDWKNWKPMKPLSDKHRYAHAANLFYNILEDYIDEFFVSYEDEIVHEWHEIYTFSQDLVENAVEPFLCKHLQKELQANPNAGKPAQPPSWYTTENRMDLNLERPFVSDSYKAVSHITTQPDLDKNKPEEYTAELNALKKACAYIIFNATFGHYWANSKQYDDIGEIRYSSLGIRLGTEPDGVLGSEDDDSIAPDLTISTQMMWWSNMLSKTGYGYIMRNEQGDINPLLIKKIKEKESEFKALGVDIYAIQSETNI